MQQTHGSTAVFYAAISGEVKVVEYLAKKGADIQINNKDGDTALMKAADFGNVAVVHYLIQLGADVMAENNVSLIFAFLLCAVGLILSSVFLARKDCIKTCSCERNQKCLTNENG